MKDNTKHWSSELITIFGFWLWEQGHHGHALLCITGPAWGMKVGHQLKLTWGMFVSEITTITPVLKQPAKDNYDRLVSSVMVEYLELAHSQQNPEMNDKVFTNSKTGKPLTTSTLNRELDALSSEFVKELSEKMGVRLKLKPLKSNAFEIAWALKNIARYSYSKKSFIAVSKHMGHRTLKDTISLLEEEPNDDIHLDFTGGTYLPQLRPSDLKSDEKLRYYSGYAWAI